MQLSPLPGKDATKRLLSPEICNQISALFSRYPTRRAVVLPALHLIQEHLKFVPLQAVVELAELLGLAPAEVQDVVSFYSGFFRQDAPFGKYRVWVCRSLSCACRGGEGLLEMVSQKLGIAPGQTTADGLVSLEVAECLGACDFSPAILVNDQMIGPITEEKLDELISSWK